MIRLRCNLSCKQLARMLMLVVVLGGLLTILTSFQSHVSHYARPQAQIQFTATKGIYLKGEPILIDIFILNTGQDLIAVDPLELQLPFAESPGQLGIYFDSNVAGLNRQPEEQIGIASSLGIDLAPGEAYKTTIRLQDFIIQPEPGHYSLPYTIALLSVKKPNSVHLDNLLSKLISYGSFIKKFFGLSTTVENCLVTNKGELVFSVKAR